MTTQQPFEPLRPDIGIQLFDSLRSLRPLYLQEGVSEAVSEVGVEAVDGELAEFAGAEALTRLAALGIRGERVFPVPSIIHSRPTLIGYYRMLLGISRKSWRQTYGYQRFENAEMNGALTADRAAEVPQLCRAMSDALAQLVAAMFSFTDRDLEDLALLTLGPTLQGQRNVAIGNDAARIVRDRIRAIAAESVEFDSDAHLRVRNAANRAVEIEFASDPDVRFLEVTRDRREPLVAIEIKGGSDVSNAHNRAGEAEKSHLKARQMRFQSRWTLIALGGVDRERLRTESPSTTDFFDYLAIRDQQGSDWDAFRNRVILALGLPDA